MRVEPRYQRIARRLTAAELSLSSSADWLSEERLFVGLYSPEGLRRVMHVYGVDDMLAARGLVDIDVTIEGSDAFHHRLWLTCAGDTVMDLRLHLTVRHNIEVVELDWLTMQNPRGSFTATHPALPGQQHPGSGMGRVVLQLLALLARRLGRPHLVAVPERFHVAALYTRVGFVPIEAATSDDLRDLSAAGLRASMNLAALSWAIERGDIVDEDGARAIFRPGPMWLSLDGASPMAVPPAGPSRRFAVRST